MGKEYTERGKLMIVYSNGDSYGLANNGLVHRVYSEFIAEKLNARLYNNGKSGSCNERIIRTTTRDLLEIREKTDEQILALINVSDVWRSEIWPQENKYPEENDGHFQSFQISSLDTNIIHTTKNDSKVYSEFFKFWFLTADYEALISNLYYKLILMTNLLKTKKINYLIWSGSRNFKEISYKIDTNAPFMKCFSSMIENDKNILPLGTFTFCDYLLNQGFKPIDHDMYGDDGHHGEPAHQVFAEYLLENYIKNIL